TVLHSDRGCQYTSYAFRRELVTNGLIQSLSGTAHCYDNARMESFFATLKKEKLYQIPTYRMKREEVKTCYLQIHLRLLQHPEDQQL
ncbi:MAG: DDE-type integrase/transposase/recombinase, partial [Ruminococcus sp.]|nr:DDE-type integrase/transposase/recombinase [Ruminococcus sp.]